ncbi:tellurite resistance TerB C-terminal domain-containing protein [Flavobacterium sp. SUN052]|uniref:tellurite resistance TerB C-terminal domain-containing protein n=1 Tax=Flavobacterium sp. SUN052 TaxID=3002441 RepID=UPI00237D87EE|nr:tellurite resistance TerB C-terminal domain-containing protein [Flavobacterium sp. SUN052]MEC4004842.1 tellurite resistance TerB C-terminal domain-containing protein [Flavobacterium sp. SUN052]
MLIFIIIVIIFFFVFSGKKKPQPPKSNYYGNAKYNSPLKRTNPVKVIITGSTSNSMRTDDSIVDVSSQSHKINSDYCISSNVPYWSHNYVYSYSEINYATTAQKNFYQSFKANFLNGEYLDLEGNTNYAFILLFDLLNEFDQHKNVSKLENQLELLGVHYPKTKSYGVTFLIQKMKSVGDSEGVERLREDHYDYQYSEVTYSTFEWRNKFKKKLNLKKEETKLLDEIWYSSNTFLNIDYCCIEIIKLYLIALPKLEERYKETETTLKEVFDEVADIVVRKHFRYRKGSTNYKYAIDSTMHEFYTNIFKLCENRVRENYGHKRKITVDPYINTPEAKEVFETRILNEVATILSDSISQIIPPDKETEIKLNLLNTTRWKIAFEAINTNYNSNAKEFEEKVVTLGNLNKENPSIENIFFEASKFIAKYDKPTALLLYIHYLYHDLKSVTFDNKQLTKSIQKSLFKTDEQFESFQNIVNQFIADKNFEKALLAVSQVYAIKRKKIQLDISSIKEVQEQHSGTVELLNEYLKEETEELDEAIKSVNANQDEIAINLTQNKEEIINSIYSTEFTFTSIHTSALEIFTKNNFSILQSEFELFAKSKGVFKNQLIDTINEICYDRLDDLLIEEDENYYTINQNYYQKLLAS